MTGAETAALIAAFRKEVEDLIPVVVNKFYFNDGVPYANEAEVLSLIPSESREQYMTVNIMGVEYWFLPDLTTLTNKVADLSITDGSIALANLANVASGTVFYRKSTGDGSPEVQTLATLKEDLGHDSTKVDKISSYSLVPDALIAKIHEAGSDNQDLSGYVLKVTDKSLISDSEISRLAGLFSAQTIILPSASTVAGRCTTPTQIPDGWTVGVGTTDQDLLITHTLSSNNITDIKVWAEMTEGDRLMIGGLAFVGVLAPTSTTILIESICTKEYPIRIELIFD